MIDHDGDRGEGTQILDLRQLHRGSPQPALRQLFQAIGSAATNLQSTERIRWHNELHADKQSDHTTTLGRFR
jgi:hypothetical protein